MRFLTVFITVLLAVASSFASYKDLFFKRSGGELTVSKQSTLGASYKADGKLNLFPRVGNDVRIRVINPLSNSKKKFGFDLERPFFILDGIYLNTEGKRTLSEFFDEIDAVGFTDLLSELGYTPILVQFNETVGKRLGVNADLFSALLRFVNNNNLFGFVNKTEDGFIVMGISQGGIIGRYGAYLYDVSRKDTDAPIRLYTSLDSPHQGAVIPKGILYTINFWDTKGGSSAAEAFNDLIRSPGAEELLITKSKGEGSSRTYEEDFSNTRFLFGEYRKAAEYKGFPSVLISEGQLKGFDPAHADTLFTLNRRAKKAGIVWGRAESRAFTTGNKVGELAYNRVYKKIGSTHKKQIDTSSKYDFIQGSTYPFASIMYNQLREGIYDAMPNGMKQTIFSLFGYKKKVTLSTSWDEDSLYQASSTFIPTVSAMDLKCNGSLAITQDCASSQTAEGLNFEKMGDRSTAKAAYAVDPTHPRFNESVSGRHIELPAPGSSYNSSVASGWKWDMWRIMCEVAKADKNIILERFRNPNLEGFFYHNASCMDATQMPLIIDNFGTNQKKRFRYARYEYDKNATELTDSVEFDLAAGWHRVALFDNSVGLKAGQMFEIQIEVTKPKSNWMKAELMLHPGKNLGGQLQLEEIPVEQDGKRMKLRWKMPFTSAENSNFRWIRLVLNSEGAHVKLSKPRLISTGLNVDNPKPLTNPIIFYKASNRIVPWNNKAKVDVNRDSGRYMLYADFALINSGFDIRFDAMRSLESYKNLHVIYEPGTCQETSVYFDSFKKGRQSLAGGVPSEGYLDKTIPIQSIIDTDVTPNNGLSASALSFNAQKTGEKCVVRNIFLN